MLEVMLRYAHIPSASPWNAWHDTDVNTDGEDDLDYTG
jgi:hypothetical protein